MSLQEVFLLDTNAYFNFLKYAAFSKDNQDGDPYKAEIERLKNGNCYISSVSRLEIVSVIGKYARGVSGSREKCNCVISETGERCGNFRYVQGRKPMKKALVGRWLQVVKETTEGVSPVFSVTELPLSQEIFKSAQTIIQHALIHNFASMDAVLAATLQESKKIPGLEMMQMVTSDKGLKACLDRCRLSYWDGFANRKS